MTVKPAVIDTNVVVSGVLTAHSASPTARILDGMLAGRFRFLLSIDLLRENREVLLRPRIRRRHGLADRDVDVVMTEVARNGALLELAPLASAAARRADEHLWQMLAAAPAAVLVTGDRRLLDRASGGARVMQVRTFADLLEE